MIISLSVMPRLRAHPLARILLDEVIDSRPFALSTLKQHIYQKHRTFGSAAGRYTPLTISMLGALIIIIGGEWGCRMLKRARASLFYVCICDRSPGSQALPWIEPLKVDHAPTALVLTGKHAHTLWMSLPRYTFNRSCKFTPHPCLEVESLLTPDCVADMCHPLTHMAGTFRS